MKKILLAGESWFIHSIHQKGFDTFNTCTYEEGGATLIAAFQKAGYAVEYQPCHIAMNQFPSSAEALGEYAAVVLSDIGSNTLLLSDEVFSRSESVPNRLAAIADYVRNGGGFAMMGGYMSFAGIEGKAKYSGTPIEGILPVGVKETDDRVEAPQGVAVEIVREHGILKGVKTPVPPLLGYNLLLEKDAADVLVRTESGDIIAAAKEVGKGRSFVFASDIAPHWAPPQFVSWDGYDVLFGNVARYICGDMV
ncbi:MAG: glutamine amidotransferase [Clostridiales Family XIII bacterium]|jgi:uncharacterized membrane protein|nr:glutamine amidotransferase [Clostridiales Family XIII bacterium]